MAKSRGLGDTIAKITEVTGIKAVVEKISEVTGVPCGCERRQESWNQLFPYNNTEPHENKITSQNINDFCEGIYIINNNLVFTRDGESNSYKVGDKVLIKLDNPFYNDFKQYYILGLISKEK